MTDTERWHPIPDFPHHHASSWGRIKNVWSGLILSGTRTRKGYQQYNLRGSKGRRTAYGHRLVAAAFIGPPPARHCVNHLDGRKNNNAIENLEYTTPRGNAQHAAALGLLRPNPLRGEQSPSAKLTEGEVRVMRVRYWGGTNAAALGREFGVTQRAAHMAVTGRTWRHVA